MSEEIPITKINVTAKVGKDPKNKIFEGDLNFNLEFPDYLKLMIKLAENTKLNEEFIKLQEDGDVTGTNKFLRKHDVDWDLPADSGLKFNRFGNRFLCMCILDKKETKENEEMKFLFQDGEGELMVYANGEVELECPGRSFENESGGYELLGNKFDKRYQLTYGYRAKAGNSGEVVKLTIYCDMEKYELSTRLPAYFIENQSVQYFKLNSTQNDIVLCSC